MSKAPLTGLVLRGLTVWRPWAHCFFLPPSIRPNGTLQQPKQVENRTWWPKWAVQPWKLGIAECRVDLDLWWRS